MPKDCPVTRMSPGSAPFQSSGRWIILTFLALGVLVRVLGFADHELWIDEYGTWWTIAGESWGEVWRRALTIQGQSPFYYLAVRLVVEPFGVGAASLRLASLVFGIGLVALSYPLAMRVFGDRRIALMTMAVFAVDERLIFYAQDARPYGLALLCACASFFFYLGLLRGAGGWTRLGYILTTTAAYYAHYLFGIILLIQALHVVMQRPRSAKRLRVWLGNFLLIGVSMVPGLWHLSNLYQRRQVLDWVPYSGLLANLKVTLAFLDPLVLGTVGGTVLLVWLLRRRERFLLPDGYRGVVLLWFAVPIVFFAVLPGLIGVSLLHPRYLAIAVPAVALACGVLLGLPRQRSLVSYLPLIVFLALVGGLRIEPMLRDKGASAWFRMHRWESATRALVANYQKDDLILFRTGFVELDQTIKGQASPMVAEFVGWPILVHLPAGGQFHLQPLPYSDTPEMRALLGRILQHASAAQRVWVVGIAPVLPLLIQMADQTPEIQVARLERYGVVYLSLLIPRHYKADRSQEVHKGPI